ncbi:MAG: DUF4157 domain-containing protein [Gammaproteobacteria bacterium]|nr:DUF4157 domain-containing protein [Gammaproteobacteria bacterium]
MRSRAESMLGADFAGVWLHPDAARVTAPLRARAVTHGQAIYFRPGEFQPGTPDGDALITHELAHTLQTRQRENGAAASMGPVSEPGDALEQNADALARGETTHVLAAPAGAALRSPFDSESAEERARRERLLTSIDNAVDRILRLLRTGGLLDRGEVATERGGVRGVIYGPAGAANESFTSYADRDDRLRRIVRTLLAMSRLYRSAPIPAEFAPPTRTTMQVQREGQAPVQRTHYQSSVPVEGGTAHFGGRSPEWADLQAAYKRYQISEGQTGAAYDFDWLYLDPAATIVPGAARGAPRIGRGVPTGAYMVVPDIEHDPLRYWRLDGYSPIPQGSTIVEFWHDDFGYYYMHRGQRIDVPSPWSP